MEVKRDIYLKRLVDRMDNGSAKVVTGLRRSGKSYLLKRLFRAHLLEQGVPDERIVHVELDNVRDERYLDSRALYDMLAQKASEGHTYAIIDEIQLLDDFAPLVNGLMYLDDIDLYVTGSNSKMLSSDIRTELRGRGDEVHVLPFSFSEFSSAKAGTTEEALREYLLYGGMPELLTRPSHEQKAAYLGNLVDKVYLDDIVERNDIRLRDELDRIFDDLCSSIGSITNPTKIANSLKSAKGSSISDNTVRNYLSYMEGAYLFEAAKRYDVKGRRYFNSLSKYYIADVGLRNARLNYRQLDEGHLIENVVFNELRLRGMSVDVGMVEVRDRDGEKSTRRQLEIDFVATDGSARYYIQVARDLDRRETATRERRPLERIGDSFKRVIITRDALMPHYDDSGVLIIGLSDFLLDGDSLRT